MLKRIRISPSLVASANTVVSNAGTKSRYSRYKTYKTSEFVQKVSKQILKKIRIFLNGPSFRGYVRTHNSF